MKRILLIILLQILVSFIYAQTGRLDTTKKTVVVTSAYKPEMKPASKINFSATAPAIDTSRPSLFYSVPAQNLFFSYQPVSLKPLALSIDTAMQWVNDNFVKLGFGNYSSPFLQAGLTFGDGTNSIISVNTKHIAQKGKLPFQQYSHSNASVNGIFNKPGSNNEWQARAGFDQFTTYQYGYAPSTLVFTKDQLRQRFATFTAMAGLRNKEVNAYGISYNPTATINIFNDNNSGSETSVKLDAPITKTFGEKIAFNVGVTADITTFKPRTGDNINNNLVYISPSVQYKTGNVFINGGIIPSWDNGEFAMLPNFGLELKLSDERFVLLGGWKGYYQKNTYQSLANYNPWLQQPGALLNTRIREQYAGFKGSAASHFTYNARVSLLSLKNAALLTNDNVDGKSFVTLYEPDMKALRLHGEIGYTVQEKFSLLGGATISQYTSLEVNEKAWGLLPLEITGALRWQVLKDLQFKSDIFFWDGPQYRSKEGERRKLNPAIDMNAGVEFKVMPKLNVWLQLNNLFNNRYERWNQYEVLGFNVLGGIVYSFSQTGK